MIERAVSYGLFQGGIMVASVTAPTRQQAWAEIYHYSVIYSQDGSCEIRELTESNWTDVPTVGG